jgi:hypothetical protein
VWLSILFEGEFGYRALSSLVGGSKEVKINGKGSMVAWCAIKSAFDISGVTKL